MAFEGKEMSIEQTEAIIQFMNTRLCKTGVSLKGQRRLENNGATLGELLATDVTVEFNNIPSDEELVEKLRQLDISHTGPGRLVIKTNPVRPGKADLERIERVASNYLLSRGKPVINELDAENIITSYEDVKKLMAERKSNSNCPSVASYPHPYYIVDGTLAKHVVADRDFLLPPLVQQLHFDRFPDGWQAFEKTFMGMLVGEGGAKGQEQRVADNVELHDGKELLITIGEQVDQHLLRCMQLALTSFASRVLLELKGCVVYCNWPAPWKKCMVAVAFGSMASCSSVKKECEKLMGWITAGYPPAHNN
jgi:hypothetical protein